MARPRLTVVLLALVAVMSTGPASALSQEETCTETRVEKLVRSFVRAYNHGDGAKLERMWAQEPHFEWYFVQGNERTDPYDRQGLGRYFAARRAVGDRLTLKRLSTSPGSEGEVGFGFRLTRTSDQRSARGTYHGKGHAVTAERDVISQLLEPGPSTACVLAVWSMGRD